MTLPQNALDTLTTIGLILAALIAIALFTQKLATEHGSDVRIVWYLFSLSLTVTFLVAWWASGFGAIDAGGSFRGRAGSAVQALLKIAVDIEGGIKLYGGVAALIVVPQLISWVLSGLVGCAAAPMFVGPTFRFFFWSVVKTLVIAGGVLLAAAVFGRGQGWNGMTNSKVLELTGTAFALVALSFFLLYAVRDSEPSAAKTSALGDGATKPYIDLRGFNAWMNRKIVQSHVKPDSSASTLNSSDS